MVRSASGRGRSGRRPGASAKGSSSLRSALDRVGDRWLLLIVDALQDGPLRFGELQDSVGAAPNILTDRLRRLEVEGLVLATPYSERPLRLDYRLSASGRDLATALIALSTWGSAENGEASARFHAPCGTALELHPWCPTCDRLADDPEVEDAYDL